MNKTYVEMADPSRFARTAAALPDEYMVECFKPWVNEGGSNVILHLGMGFQGKTYYICLSDRTRS